MSGAGQGEVFSPLEADDPTSVGAYRLAAKLGAGGMGKVYLSHTPAGRPVAVKVIRPEFAEDAEFRRRFKQEVQAAQRVQGLYTAPVIDSDADGTRPWLATAFVPGPTLASAVAGHGPLPVQTVLLLVAGIAEALEAVHAAGLVHRDLKPSNVLLASDGPRVIDFGIARAADTTALTASGVTIGTPAFMSPEQAAGREITPATDVFALGQVAAYAVLGAPAYGDGPSHAVLYRIVHEEPDLARIPEELRALVGRCLVKEPAERPTLADVVGMCRAASQQTELRRPEQWLPSALAAEIPARHVAPGSPAAPPVPSSPPPAPADAAPKDAAPPAPSTPPPPATAPATPAVTPPAPAAAPATPPPTAAEGPYTPPPQVTRPDVAPAQPAQPAAAAPAPAPVQPAQPAQPAAYAAPPPQPHPQAPDQQQPGPAAYAYPATQPSGSAASPSYGYPQGGSPYAPQGQFGAPQDPHGTGGTAPQPPRKNRRKLLALTIAGAIVVIAGAVGGAMALNGGGDKKDDAKNSSPAVHKASPKPTTEAPTTSPADDTEPTDDPTDEPTDDPSSAADPNPEPEPHNGIQLPADYHLDFSDHDITPQTDTGDDLTYDCSFDDCSFTAYDTKLVLLDHDEAGSLDTCMQDTRYTQSIAQARLSAGSQICARTPQGTVALITYQKASKATEASTYVVLDVTLWRNALPNTDDNE